MSERPDTSMDGSVAFKAFAVSVFQQGKAIDLRALRSLKGLERRAARDMILERLLKHPEDARIARAVSTLRDPQLLAPTRAAFDQAPNDSARVAFAVALRLLGAFEGTDGVALRALESPERDARIAAIKALSEAFPGPVDARLEILAAEDPDPRVKMAAAEALKRRQDRWG